MAQQRDLARTREKLLAAAATEFAAKGLAGARVDTIARRARVNKRMLYYCFGSKRELYREILQSKLTERTQFLDSMPTNIEEALLHIYENSTGDTDFVRMLEWEALDSSPAARMVASDARHALFAKAMEKFGEAQKIGVIPADVDPRHLFISFIACSVFPLAFPQMMRLVTGLDPTDPRFKRGRREFLRWLGRRLAGGKAAGNHPANGTATNGKLSVPRQKRNHLSRVSKAP
jgi:TetR/AcrR family transcriptional regulator